MYPLPLKFPPSHLEPTHLGHRSSKLSILCYAAAVCFPRGSYLFCTRWCIYVDVSIYSCFALVIYICQCYSPNSSHPLLRPLRPHIRSLRVQLYSPGWTLLEQSISTADHWQMLGYFVEMEIMSETKEIGICAFWIVPFVPCKKVKKWVTHFPKHLIQWLLFQTSWSLFFKFFSTVFQTKYGFLTYI